jgi:CrcB protein
MKLIAVFIGGGLGSLARYGMGSLVSYMSWTSPWGTLISNVLATAILLFILGQTANEIQTLSPRSQAVIALLTVGFCGAFSTFSTFAADTIQLHQTQGILWAICNVSANLICCMAIGLWMWQWGAARG